MEDPHVGNDYKIQFSIGLFNAYINDKNYGKAFEFYGLNAEYIPIDNLAVYENFKELIRNCNSAQSTSVLSRSVVSAISKQEIYNKRIDTLLAEVSGFIKKVYKYIEDEPEMKKNLQTLGTGSQLNGKTNIFEGLYEYNLVFYECGIKAIVNQDMSTRSWEEKYEMLELLYTTLNVVFDGYNVYEISNKIEHQYIELTWINNYVNANPNLLKQFFSVKEKIKAFKVRKNSILEKSKTNYEIKKMIDDRQKHLLFMAAEDMIVNGLGGGKLQIISSGYDLNTAKKYLQETYAKIVLPAKYGQETQTSGGGFFGKNKSSAADADLARLLRDASVEEMLCKSEWLWNQHNDKGLEKPTAEEATYAVACLVKVIHRMLDKKGTSKAASAPNKKVIITKTGKVIELSDESGQAPVKQQESGVIEAIDNIVVLLKDKSEENVKYVKAYIEDLLNALMKTKWDKDTMLSQFDAEELRAKSFQVIKRLNMDMLV